MIGSRIRFRPRTARFETSRLIDSTPVSGALWVSRNGYLTTATDPRSSAPPPQFRHPANNLTFLRLLTLDWCPPTFGIHYGTAITACQILACNEDGYLSTSRDRNSHGRINVDLDSIMPYGLYYYHISSQKSEALSQYAVIFLAGNFRMHNSPRPGENELPDQTTGFKYSNTRKS